ncbi:hypothetical protein EJB05_22110, partial [Eragrostis curvula]
MASTKLVALGFIVLLSMGLDNAAQVSSGIGSGSSEATRYWPEYSGYANANANGNGGGSGTGRSGGSGGGNGAGSGYGDANP